MGFASVSFLANEGDADDFLACFLKRGVEDGFSFRGDVHLVFFFRATILNGTRKG